MPPPLPSPSGRRRCRGPPHGPLGCGRAQRGHRGGAMTPSLRVPGSRPARFPRGTGTRTCPASGPTGPAGGSIAGGCGTGPDGTGALSGGTEPYTRSSPAIALLSSCRRRNPPVLAPKNPSREQPRQTRLGRAAAGFPGIFAPPHGELGGKTVSVSRKRLKGGGSEGKQRLEKSLLGGFKAGGSGSGVQRPSVPCPPGGQGARRAPRAEPWH